MHSLLAPFLVTIYCLTFAFTITPLPTHLCDLLGGGRGGLGRLPVLRLLDGASVGVLCEVSQCPDYPEMVHTTYKDLLLIERFNKGESFSVSGY